MQEKVIQRSDKRSTSTRKSIRFSNELIALINEAKADEGFSSWVFEACKEKLSKANLPIEKSEE